MRSSPAMQIASRGQRNAQASGRLKIAWACLFLGLALAGVHRVCASTPPRAILDGYYETWIRSVSHLITDAERQAFLGLEDPRRKEAFIRGFWQARPGRGAFSPLRRWHENFENAQGQFVSLAEDRARAMMMAGKPGRVTRLRSCQGQIRPLEVWSYESWHVEHQTGRGGAEAFSLVFVQEKKMEPRVFRLWSPGDGIEPLIYGQAGGILRSLTDLVDFVTRHRCLGPDGDEPRRFANGLRDALTESELRRRLRVEPPEPGWFQGVLTAVDDGKGLFPGASLELEFPGRYLSSTLLLGRLSVPVARLKHDAQGMLLDRVTLLGDIRAGDRLVDSFRVVHHLVGAQPQSPTVCLELYRRLRPGPYTLSLRAEDSNGLGLARERVGFEVPRLDVDAAAPPGVEGGFGTLIRKEVITLMTFPSVELLPLGETLLVGEVEVEAVTTGGPIHGVVFRLDGAPAGRDHKPPYLAHLSLGADPRPHRIEAVAMDLAGREIARDQLEINHGPQRFAVHLKRTPAGAAKTEASVEVPADKTLDRVELYLNRRRLAILRQPPFEAPLPDLLPETPTYLRAVAVLESGESMEDLFFLPSSTPVETVDVQLVELYTTVVDAQGRPVTHLGVEDFRVFEDGVRQTIEQATKVSNLAMNVALLMDTSSSMRRKVEVAAASARRFFQQVLTPRDLASFLTFNHDIRLVVPFTPDVRLLGYGASGLRAWGSTRLYDAVLYATHSFGGLRSKRALVVLTDGNDVASDFPFVTVVEHTLRSGIAVYPIVLGTVDSRTQEHLERLARETGGRSFWVGQARDLDGVYRRIEDELRSQYLLVYCPPPRSGSREFRRVEVQALGAGLRARTIHGYYP